MTPGQGPVVSLSHQSTMEASRVVCLVLVVTTCIALCSATSESCGPNERSNSGDDCQRTCNACRDCGPCRCKPGYIRVALAGECIPELECHKLHLQWLHDAKYNSKKDMFFNCS